MKPDEFADKVARSTFEAINGALKDKQTGVRFGPGAPNKLRDSLLWWFKRDQSKHDEMLSLIDGCYEVVELWNATTPSQIEWKRNWLERARAMGAQPE